MASARDPLELVSLRQLRYFNAAMQADSFNEAARHCAISQPALSEQIAALEAVLGLRLFDRVGRSARPTQPARQLHQRLAASMADLQSALRATSQGEERLAGRLRIGLVGSYGSCWVGPVVRAAQARWPELSVVLQRRTATALVDGLVRGDLDLAVSFDAEPHAELESLACFREGLVAVGRRWARRRRPLDLAQLAQEPLALLPPDYAMRRQIDRLFSAAGLRPRVRFESDALEDLMLAAREGGLTAVVNAAAALSLGVQGALPIAGPGLQRQACLLRSRSRYQTQAALQVWERLADAAQGLRRRLEGQDV